MRSLRPLAVVTASAAALSVAACASPGPVPVNDPAARMSRPSQAPQEAIRWSAERRLTWSDFSGDPQPTSAAAAVTTYVLWWQADCTRDGFAFEVLSAFIPDQSWVKRSVLERSEESRRALGHEQTHFDLSEVHARKMRQALARLSQPCRLTEEELLAAVEPIIQEDTQAQADYDRQTAHGLDRLQQSQWDDAVQRQLAALSRYVGAAGTQAIPTGGGPGHRDRRVSVWRGAVGLPIAGVGAPRMRTAAGR